MSFESQFDRIAREIDPKKPFFVFGGKILLYGELLDRIARLNGLFSEQIPAGTHVALLTRDPVDLVTLLLAGLRSNVAVLNLNTEMTPPEIRLALKAAKIGHVFADEEILRTCPLPDTLGVSTLRSVMTSNGDLLGRLLNRKKPDNYGLTGLLADYTPTPAPAAQSRQAMRLMLLTSGTSSAPKVVQLSCSNIDAQLATFRRVFDYDSSSRILNPLPLHFTDGMMHGPIVAFLAGATLYRPNSEGMQMVEDILTAVSRDGITHLNLVPAILALMNRTGAKFDDAFVSPDFRYIRCSGDRLPLPLWAAIEERFGVRVANTYGMSETVCEALFCGPADSNYMRGTCGQPVDCEVRIVDPDSGAAQYPGEVGELLIRGDCVMEGYLGDPASTAAVLQDKWLHTGDDAVIDADGFVTVLGRRSNVIISGGINIQPRELVDTALSHPTVTEAACFGLPDPEFGEVVACAVVLHQGLADLPGEVELTKHFRAAVSPHKVPRMIRVLDTLPRNPAGKVLVAELRKRLADAPAQFTGGDLESDIIATAARTFSCRPEDLSPDSNPGTILGWDSLGHVRLYLAAEQRYGITFTAEDMLRVNFLSDFIALVARRRNGP